MTKVYVGDSVIHGKGVFAATSFEPGDEILRIDDSKEVSREQWQSEFTEREIDYCDYLADDKIVFTQPPERHINHSCDPNT